VATLTPQWQRDRAAIFKLCNAFSLTRGERIEIAATFLNRNVESFNDLDPGELARLRDAFEGAALVCHVQIEKRRGLRC
jgi:hypothetical protein